MTTKFLFSLFLIAFSASASSSYEIYVDDIVRSFTKEMEREFPLSCSGSGGSMPHKVEQIDVFFVSSLKASIAEARQMQVIGIQKLLKMINNHKGIRPYLKEYPFQPTNVNICISFQKEDGERPLDGNLALVFSANGTIVYNAAELRIIKAHPIINLTDHELPKELFEDKEDEVLTTLLEETYEEAVTALENQEKKQNQKPL